MGKSLRVCGIFAAVLFPVLLQGQLICNPPSICSCENEKVSPNLTIERPVKLTGLLVDPSGAPIQFNRTTVQVRKPGNHEVLFSAVLDRQGRFDLGTVPAGRFRLIAFWTQPEKVSRLPLFDQPKPVSCSSANKCELKIVLALHGTDQGFEFCPPK
jgi:hypothetical protein